MAATEAEKMPRTNRTPLPWPVRLADKAKRPGSAYLPGFLHLCNLIEWLRWLALPVSFARGVLDCLTNKEIALSLKISESSVKAVIQELFQKAGVRTRSQLVRIVIEKHSSDWLKPRPQG